MGYRRGGGGMEKKVRDRGQDHIMHCLTGCRI